MGLHIGTSGFAYKEWKDGFYPPDLPQRAFLEFYSRELTACEINATFYRLQSQSTFEKWRSEVPGSFRFATKAHRRLTHRKQFAPNEETAEFLERFTESLAALDGQLGCVLFQFPPFVKRDDDQLQALVDAIPNQINFACEFRDDSWDVPEVEAALAQNGGTVCISETAGEVLDRLPAGPVGYVRLRSQTYSDEARTKWLELLQAESRERDVYAFAKHAGIPAGDPNGGVGMAQWLVEHSAAGT